MSAWSIIKISFAVESLFGAHTKAKLRADNCFFHPKHEMHSGRRDPDDRVVGVAFHPEKNQLSPITAQL